MSSNNATAPTPTTAGIEDNTALGPQRDAAGGSPGGDMDYNMDRKRTKRERAKEKKKRKKQKEKEREKAAENMPVVAGPSSNPNNPNHETGNPQHVTSLSNNAPVITDDDLSRMTKNQRRRYHRELRDGTASRYADWKNTFWRYGSHIHSVKKPTDANNTGGRKFTSAVRRKLNPPVVA